LNKAGTPVLQRSVCLIKAIEILHIHSGARSGLQFVLDLVGAAHPCGGHPEKVSPRVGASGIADAHLPLHLSGHPLPIVG